MTQTSSWPNRINPELQMQLAHVVRERLNIKMMDHVWMQVHYPRFVDLPCLLDVEFGKLLPGKQDLFLRKWEAHCVPKLLKVATLENYDNILQDTEENGEARAFRALQILTHLLPPIALGRGKGWSKCSVKSALSYILDIKPTGTSLSMSGAVGCSALRSLENGQTSVRYRGLLVIFNCRPGYKLHGHKSSSCVSGRWSREPPTCVGSGCPHPVPVAHGSFRLSSDASWVQFSCDEGYRLIGPSALYCKGLEWNSSQPLCADLDECTLPVAETGCLFGCVNTAGGFYCLCPPGYTLPSPDAHCQDFDECAANGGLGPCSERCHNSAGSFHCSCSRGFTLAGDGLACIPDCPKGYRKLAIFPNNSTLPPAGQCVDFDECSRDNGGCSHVCVNLRGTFKCSCPSSLRFSTHSWRKCVPRRWKL
uniref:Uncharacterized protein n=1 Tax=Knipowitschia caucasica TaxID=637954 RepID=A0AAV2LQZ6_KNICA